jgi:gluconate 2-dehydrogenase gamma chain
MGSVLSMIESRRSSISRRAAVRRIAGLLGGSLYAPTLTGLLAGCEVPPGDEGYEPRTLDPDQRALVDVIAEMIIPATDTPGASAAGVPRFIDAMLTDFYSEEQRNWFLEALGSVDAVAASRFGVSFAEASTAQRDEVLFALDQEAYPDPSQNPARAEAVAQAVAAGQPPFMRLMKELTVSGYYTSEIGQTVELRQPPFGTYQADVPFDEIGRSWA